MKARYAEAGAQATPTAAPAFKAMVQAETRIFSSIVKARNITRVLTIVIAAALAHHVLDNVVPIQFFTSLIVAFVWYPFLRLTVLRPQARPRVVAPA